MSEQDAKPIRRCVCAEVSFAEIAESGSATLDEVAERFGAGTHCGLCLPYLRRVLETGETKFGL